MLKLFESLTAIGAVLAALLLVTAFFGDVSAPQQGAAAAMALGFVVIPYCVLGMLQRRAMLDRMPPAPSETSGLTREQQSFEPLEF